MARIQSQFELFHERIRIDYDMSSELREKRDIVLERIRKDLFSKGRPGFSEVLQGSYKMKTGVKPIGELEYDIDVGLRFGIDAEQYSATEVRGWILDAVSEHTESVQSRAPCIRVRYAAGYHLDLVAYAVTEDPLGRATFKLAHKSDGWRPADPPALLKYVDDYRVRFEGTEDTSTKTDQFRRCVRCLRRWNDVRLPRESHEKPIGLGLVLLAILQGLSPGQFVDGEPDDRGALEALVSRLGGVSGRLTATKPTPEYEDVLARISDDAMASIKAGLKALAGALVAAGQSVDPVEACKGLREHFGEDFPVPDPVERSRKSSAPAILTSSRSA
jgi:hypothetical protein